VRACYGAVALNCTPSFFFAVVNALVQHVDVSLLTS
jgi:hypothetical protein